MKFYLSLNQLMEGLETLGQSVQFLSSRALRISPRDARANRDLLDQCSAKLGEVSELLDKKIRVSKIALRNSGILYDLLDVFYRRTLHLAASSASLGADEKESIQCVWPLLSQAQKHYHQLAKTLFAATDLPVTLKLDAAAEYQNRSFPVILQDDSAFQREALKLLDRAVELFGEEADMAGTLEQTRKEMLETRRWMNRTFAVAKSEKLMENMVSDMAYHVANSPN